MRTITAGFGREVNGPYSGQRVASGKRGVWLLPLDAWASLQQDVIGACREYGPILFAGVGYGINTVTGQAGEPGFVVVLDYSNGPHWTSDHELRGVAELWEALGAIARKYGQLEIAFTDGRCEMVRA